MISTKPAYILLKLSPKTNRVAVNGLIFIHSVYKQNSLEK